MTETEIHGRAAPGFEPVREAFARNFAEELESGAAFAARVGGETVLDLWGGTADAKSGAPWREDTLAPVFSTGKAVCAVIVASLVERGLVAYEDRLAALWPEFAEAGKAAVTIGEALSHQAGVPGFREEFDPAEWFDREAMAARLAAEAPFWEPGTACGYHPITFGIIAQEICLRADGRTLGSILREDFAGPRGLDLMIGTPESEHGRCARIEKPRGYADFGELNDETRAAFLQPWSAPGGRGSAEWRKAEVPAANGHATARALAAFMDILALEGTVDGRRVLSPDTLAALTRIRVEGADRVLPYAMRYAAGLYGNPQDGAAWFGPGAAARGHYGFGGSCAFGDPGRGVSAAYVMNRQGRVLAGDPRPLRVIAALYEAL